MGLCMCTNSGTSRHGWGVLLNENGLHLMTTYEGWCHEGGVCRKTAELLSKESSCKIENGVAERFRQNVLNGYWDAALNDLKALQVHLAHTNDYMTMKFMVLEQKYLELLERGAVRHDLCGNLILVYRRWMR